MTNSLARATYRQRVTQFTEELTFLSEEDKDWIMGRAILARSNGPEHWVPTAANQCFGLRRRRATLTLTA